MFFKRHKIRNQKKKQKKTKFDTCCYNIKLYKNKTKKQNVINNNYYSNIY